MTISRTFDQKKKEKKRQYPELKICHDDMTTNLLVSSYDRVQEHDNFSQC